MSAPEKYTVGDDVTLGYCTDSGLTPLTMIVGLVDVKLPKLTSPDVDTTAIDAAADTSQAGRPKADTLTFTTKFNQTQSTNLLALQLAQTSVYWKALLDNALTVGNATATGNSMAFCGYIKEHDSAPDVSRNKAVVSQTVVQVTGTLTLA